MRARGPFVAALAALIIACVVRAQDGQLESGMPVGVKIRGFVGEAPKGTVPADSWVVDVKGKHVKFQVIKLDVLNGNTFYMSIFSALDPYEIALNFVGEDLDKILNAAAGQELTIIGNMQFGGGARLLIISSVTTAEATPTASQ
jgi:hypothetical protein